MSGIEIAGLVLGGFPLLVSAAEHYKEGWEPLVRWRRFRTEFLRFIDAIDIEKQLFDQMLERFLISAEVSQDEPHHFLTDPNYHGWHQEDLAMTLKSRLGHSYEAFVGSIRTMNELMVELESMLSLKDGKFDWADEGASTWDYQLKRIRHSFSRRGTITIETLEKHNRKLRELLDSNDKLDSTRKAYTRLSKTVRIVIVESLTKFFRLQQRTTGDWSSLFNLLFEYPEDIKGAAQTSYERQELVVSAKPASAQIISHVDHFLHPSAAVIGRKKLRRNFESKSTSEINVTTQPILIPTPSSSSTISQSSSQRSLSSNHSTALTSVSTNVIVEENHTKKWLSGLKSKARKSVRIHIPHETVNSTPLALQIDLCVQTSSSASPLTSQSLTAPKYIKINDLCKVIYDSRGTSNCYLGYLSDDHQISHEFRIPEEDPIARGLYGQKFISLETILSKPDKVSPLNRYERYKVAYILASSLLQLQNAPWLTGNLQKRHILFPCDWNNHKILIDQPHLSHSFLSTRYQSTPPGQTPNLSSSTTTVKKSLNDLGIVLLELCFGQRIEGQSIRQDFLVDGKEHAGTNYLTALEWADAVCEQEPALEHVIKCCMFCIFEEKANWDNLRFTQAVYASVVEPLEKVVKSWPNIS
ncbi:hypothetical protein BPAE_0155g00250 [Botrytis paeoniae]|uniref:DUF7580 domain-containing protein n=1 Tax=Botrytis paeoniae TaxID=278948 RepID=A0A4Z1FMB3_9HELO|nr:hypothetical protein BPAE_0155g00250 [Botrytis paeoniae]